MSIPRVANLIEEGRFGGPQKRIALVAECLKHDIETTIIFPTEESQEFQKFCKDRRVNFIKVQLSPLRKNPKVLAKYIWNFFNDVVRLYKIFRKESFDLVHISGGCWQVRGLIACALVRQKVVWHFNDTSTPIVFRLFAFVFQSQVSAFIFASLRTKDYYQRYLDITKPHKIIASPVETKKFPLVEKVYRNQFSPSEW